MRRSKAVSIGEILPAVIEDLCGKEGRQRLFESRIIEAWNEVLGTTVATYSSDLKIENGTLFVRISSAMLRHELFMQRQLIVDKLNAQVGEKVINALMLR